MSDDNTKTPVEVGQVWDTISDGRIRVIKGNGLGQWEVELVNAPGKGGVMTERHFTRLIKLPPLTPAEIAELRKLEAAATIEPWWPELFRDKDKRENTLLIKYKWDDVPTWICELSNHNDAMQNANLIAALSNFAPRLLAAAEREGRMREAIVAAIDGLESGMFHFKQSGLDTEGRYAMNSIANALANLKIRYAKISERAE